MKKFAAIALLAAACVLNAQTDRQHRLPSLGGWEYSQAIHRYEWIPPADCKTWPEGLTFAGGIVYDHHGCAYAKIDGKCDIEMLSRVPDCMEKPPVPYPANKIRNEFSGSFGLPSSVVMAPGMVTVNIEGMKQGSKQRVVLMTCQGMDAKFINCALDNGVTLEDIANWVGYSEQQISEVVIKQQTEIVRLERKLREGQPCSTTKKGAPAN